ncbi:MgtC/SapB family protein [Candidatus Pacearchaeota archaeon]|nr:MgtC/SapB family protein [Candidatus Pacearchaeota archaeon]
MEFLNFGIAIFLGALMGLQREFSQQKEHIRRFAGLRTFILITFLGSILGFLGGSVNSLPVVIGFIGIIIFSFLSYIITFLRFKGTTVLTEIAAILAFIIGVMCTTGYVETAIIFGILVTAFLAFKEKLHGLIRKLERKEVFAVIKFALISLVVLPILPNRDYSPTDIPGFVNFLSGLGLKTDFLVQLNVFNFHSIWFMVILVAGVGFFGYFLTKIIGSKKGHGLTGFLGGLASSTAVTLSMSEESKNKKNVKPYLLATIIAMSIMFLKVLIEVTLINSALLSILFLPMAIMLVLGVLSSFYFLRGKEKKESPKEVALEQPFAIKPALKFGLLFLLVLLVAKTAQILFGSTGIYVAGIFSGMADVDAITLSMSSLSKAGTITELTASTAILFAAVSNTLVKMGIAFFMGDKKFGRIIIGIFTIILIAGLAVLFFV